MEEGGSKEKSLSSAFVFGDPAESSNKLVNLCVKVST